MKEKTDILVQIYDEYFKCSNPNCHSIYHTSNFERGEFECRDCGTTSTVPKEARKPRKH